MSKVILKIGQSTQKVDPTDIKSVSFGKTPKTTIKYSSDGTVLFFDRNPFYVTITEPDTTSSVGKLIEEYEKTGDEKYLSMAMSNIHSCIASYVSSELFVDFSESMVNALRNAKHTGRRQGEQNK